MTLAILVFWVGILIFTLPGVIASAKNTAERWK